DSRSLLVTALPGNLTPVEFVRKFSPESADSSSEMTAEARVAAVTVYSSSRDSTERAISEAGASDPWNLNRFQRSLLLIDIATGRSERLVDNERIAKFYLSPHGSRIAYSAPRKFQRPGSQQILFDLMSVELRSHARGTVARLVLLDYDGAGFSWSADGEKLGFVSGGPGVRASDCYVVDTPGSAPRNLTRRGSEARAQGHSGRPVWDQEGNIYFVSEGALWTGPAGGAKPFAVTRIEGWVVKQVFATPTNGLWTDDAGSFAVLVAHNAGTKEEGLFRLDLR